MYAAFDTLLKPVAAMIFQVGPRVALLLIAASTTSTAAYADLVKLLNGGELRGKILPASDNKSAIRIETLTGALVIVDRSETEFVTMRSPTVEEYETRARHVEDTWEAHWELAEWCRLRGLTKQREAQLLRVTELSPEHQRAQIALRRVWHKGQWVDRDAMMASQGYVKYKNRYITTQELEVLEKTAEELKLERDWAPKVRTWLAWYDDPTGARNRQGYAELKAIQDPYAATSVIKYLCTDSRVEVRTLATNVLIRMSGSKAVAGLVQQAVFDDSPDVRTLALEGIDRDFYQEAQAGFIRSLRSDYNAVICRAATALGQIGDQQAIEPLIDALITAHHYQVPTTVTIQPQYSFSTDGNFAPSGTPLPAEISALARSGNAGVIVLPPPELTQRRMMTVRVDHYNVEVLNALEKLTTKNYGYDRRTWKLWWSAEKNQGGKVGNTSGGNS